MSTCPEFGKAYRPGLTIMVLTTSGDTLHMVSYELCCPMLSAARNEHPADQTQHNHTGSSTQKAAPEEEPNIL